MVANLKMGKGLLPCLRVEKVGFDGVLAHSLAHFLIQVFKSRYLNLHVEELPVETIVLN